MQNYFHKKKKKKEKKIKRKTIFGPKAEQKGWKK